MSSPLSAEVESILDRFDDAWNGPVPPCIEDYLRPCEPPKRLALLVELIQIDLERRLTRGERIRLEETYLSRFPQLKADRSSVVALAAREFQLRRRREPRLSSAEYLERWPQYRDELIGRLGSHPTLSSHEVGTQEGKAPAVERQANEETRDVVALFSPPQAADEIGRLGGYRILKVLGSGGMGVVFLAEDTQLHRPVALKIMRPGLAANDAARQRFLREARAVAALKHDHIVTIYQVGEDRGVPFLAMEYLEGETLGDRLKREPILPVVEVLRLGIEIAEALAAAHARGLIHRDIKPGNIWLEHANRSLRVATPMDVRTRLKLLDFGLARSAGGEDAHLTQTGVILGTPAFMSPEQARGEKVDPRCDLFSLGCVLYRMVTGQMAFQGRDMMSTLLSLANDHPKPPRELNPRVPPALNHLIQRLLAKNIADRPPSAAALVATLRSIEDEWRQPVPAVAVAETPAVPAVVEAKPAPRVVRSAVPVPKLPRRRRLAIVALAVFGMAVLLGAIIIRIRGKDGRETTIEVPEGSQVTIEQDGKVAVDLSRDRKGAVVPPLAAGTDVLSSWALVRRPASLKGVQSWTIETRNPRAGALSLAMSPDGRQLAVRSFDGVIRLYDPSSGRLQKALNDHQDYLLDRGRCLSWSPDSKRLASCYLDGALIIWSAATGQVLRTIHPPPVGGGLSVAWSPDGKMLALAQDHEVTLWDAESGKQIPFKAETKDASELFTLAWSPDSKILAASCKAPGGVWLWKVPSGKVLYTLKGFKGDGRILTFSPNGKTLVAAGELDKEFHLLDVHSGKVRQQKMELATRSCTAAFSPDGKTLAVGGAGEEKVPVRLYETESWKQIRQLSARSYPRNHLTSISWSPDGTRIAANPYSSVVTIFDVSSGKAVRWIEHHSLPFPDMNVAWSVDGKKIAASLGENEGGWRGVRIWDAESGAQLRRIESAFGALRWSPHGKLLAVLGDCQVHILDGKTGQPLRSWEDARIQGTVWPVWSPDDKLIATSAKDKTVLVWAAASGRLVHTLKGHTENVLAMAWSPDGKLIASSSWHGPIRLWDVAWEKELHSLDFHEYVELEWSPDGKSLALGPHYDYWRMHTWDVKTKQLQCAFGGRLLGWSADSKAVLSFKISGLVSWWDRQTGELLRRVTFPFLNWPKLDPSGHYLATYNGVALHVGDLSRGTFPLTIVPLRAGQWLAIGADGHYRGSPGVEKEIVYIVRTDAGQEVLAPDAFAKKYGWKNDPQRVRLPRK